MESGEYAMDGMYGRLTLVDVTQVGEQDRKIVREMGTRKVPKVLALNKIDLVPKERLLTLMASFADAGYDALIPISAKTGDGLPDLEAQLVKNPVSYTHLLAMALAVVALKNKEVERIVLTRPAVEAGEKLGFLPGDLTQKVDPYLRPLYDALYDFMGVDSYQKLVERGVVEVAPLALSLIHICPCAGRRWAPCARPWRWSAR